MDTGETFFNLFPYFFGFIFIIILGTFIVGIIKGISQWRKNEQSPRLSVPVIVKTKRTNVSHHHHPNDNHPNHHTSTSYYITFEFDSGDRSEFSVSGAEYGKLAEGDYGVLTFQGTRYPGFERKYENLA